MTLLAPDFDVVDCSGDDSAPSAGAGTATAVNARPAHSRRFRRLIVEGSKVWGFLYSDFMRLTFCVSEFVLLRPSKFHEEWLISADLLGYCFPQISRARRPPNVWCAHF